MELDPAFFTLEIIQHDGQRTKHQFSTKEQCRNVGKYAVTNQKARGFNVYKTKEA